MRVVSVIRFQNVLTYFVMIDLLSQVRAKKGDVCRDQFTKPCADEDATHIEAVHECLFHPIGVDATLRWKKAGAICKLYDAKLAEPHTEKEATALCEYAKNQNITTYWIGLSYDEDKKDFTWSRSKRPIRNVYKLISSTSKNGICVRALFRKTCFWRRDNCSLPHNYICSLKSELMPDPPKIYVAFNITGAAIVAGSTLLVNCEALLSSKGDLRIALISNGNIELFDEKNRDDVYYKETLKHDQRNLCKRHASISIIFKTTLDMDGKTVACVNYKDEAIQMCSQYDPYCDVAGTIRVTEAPVSKWWLLSIPLILIILLPVLLILRKLRKWIRKRASRSTTTYTGEPDTESKYGTTRSTVTDATIPTVTDDDN